MLNCFCHGCSSSEMSSSISVSIAVVLVASAFSLFWSSLMSDVLTFLGSCDINGSGSESSLPYRSSSFVSCWVCSS